MIMRWLLLSSIALGLSACTGWVQDSGPEPIPEPRPKPLLPPPPAGTVEVYTSTGARQCESGGFTLEDRQKELKAVGVQVLAASCGSDGRMYAAVCGGTSSKIYIFTIPSSDWPKVQPTFDLVSKLPEASKSSCN